MPNRDSARRRRQQAESKARARVRSKLWLKEYLRSNPCVDCGQDDIRVLEFDHREPAKKLGNISRLARDGASLNMLIREVLKCEVRCCNCHRLRTLAERHWIPRREPNVKVYDSGG